MIFEAYATRRVSLNNLFVQQSTFGQSHSFDLDAGKITISLPSEPTAYEFREGLASDPENPLTTWYGFEEVSMRLDLSVPIQFKGDDTEFNGIEVVRSASANKAFGVLEIALDDGLDAWKRTLRWTAFAPEIDMSEIETTASQTVGLGFKVFRRSDDALFRAHGGRSTSHGGGKVTQDAWCSAGNALADGRLPPVWFDYLFDALRHRIVGDYRAAIIEAAVASETLVRTTLHAVVPPIANDVARRIIETANIQGLLARWSELTNISKAEAKKNGLSAVHALFNLRNEVMHSGLKERSALSEVVKLLPSITKFILAGDEHLRLSVGNSQAIFPAERTVRRLTSDG
jgi:hypothetical protein